LELEASKFRDVQYDLLGEADPMFEQGPMKIKQANIEHNKEMKTRATNLELQMQFIIEKIKRK
jgi:hypothetical protein